MSDTPNSSVPQLNCQLTHAEADQKSLTVGEIFYLQCPLEGQSVDPANLALISKTEDQYKINLVKAEALQDSVLKLEVTSYKVGDHNLEGLLLKSPSGQFLISPQKLTVASVMDPKEPTTEPYGPQSPVILYLSIWVWITLAIFLMGCAFIVISLFRKRAIRKKQLSQMRIFDQALPPYQQFHQVLRRIQRENIFLSGGEASEAKVDQPLGLKKELVKEIKSAYLFYLARVFLVPTEFLSERRVVSDIKSISKRRYSRFAGGLKKCLSELNRGLKAETLSNKDLRALLDLIKGSVQEINLVDQEQSLGDRE